MDSKYLKYPSEMQNVHCSCIYDEFDCDSGTGSFRLFCSWNPPWNTQYYQTNTIHYELWVQKFGDEGYKSHIVLETEISLTEGLVDSLYYVWIRAIVNEAQGPFTFTTCATSR